MRRMPGKFAQWFRRTQAFLPQCRHIWATLLGLGTPGGHGPAAAKGMKVLRFLFGLVLMGALGATGFVALTLWYFERGLPDYSQLGDYPPPVVTRIQAGDGRLLAEYATEKRVFVPVTA